VTVTNCQGQQIEWNKKSEVEKACMEENETQFQQANNTPFMTLPLVEEFGYLGIGTNAQSVLRGNQIPPSGMDPYAACLLTQFQVPQPASS